MNTLLWITTGIFIGSVISTFSIGLVRMCKKKTTGYYSREDLIRAQEIYHENYNAEPDVFAPIFTKEGAAYHMNYILGIIDGDSYKMNDEFPEPPPPRRIVEK